MEPPGRARLVLEARHELLGEIGVEQVLAHRLDRDRALDVRVDRLVDDPHRPLAEDRLDFVLADALGGHAGTFTPGLLATFSTREAFRVGLTQSRGAGPFGTRLGSASPAALTRASSSPARGSPSCGRAPR